MPRPRKPRTNQEQPARKPTPTFLLELPLAVTPSQAKRVRAHLEAARQVYNAICQKANAASDVCAPIPPGKKRGRFPRLQKLERQRAFAALRAQYGFSEYALHEAAKGLRVSWLADHMDAVVAQTLATRAYCALNRVCLGQARRVRFKSRGRGMGSIENKRNDTGLRFVLHSPEEGNRGALLWQGDQLRP